jgi:uncharacterized cupin superfamily protein
MEHVPVDDLHPEGLEPGVERHRLSEPLGTTGVAVNRYRIAPGEGLPGGLHAHADQEEVFVVLEGEATFDVLAPRRGTEPANDEPAAEVVVREGGVVRFAPGEFQSGRNGSAEELVVLALGAPRDSEDVRFPVDCPACGHGEMRMDAAADGFEFVCPACGAARVPAPCPACGDEDLRVTLDDPPMEGETAVVCSGCGTTFESPPFRG